MPDLLALLRQRTRSLHARLDSGIDLATGLTLGRYAAFLRATHRALAPLEPELVRWLPDGSSPSASRVSRLVDDLSRLEIEPDARASGDVMPRTLAEAYGCAYVIEGSALGGTVLARAIGSALGSDTPMSYLRLHDDGGGRAWRAFLARLYAWDASCSDDEREEAAAMAVRTFRAYASSYEREGLLVETTDE